jgi:hypothetical protein
MKKKSDHSLAEEKAAHRIAEQSLQTSDEARVNLAWDLESIQASLTATANKLASKSSALNTAVIQAHEMEIKLKAAKEKLKATEEKLKMLRKRRRAKDSCWIWPTRHFPRESSHLRR